MSAPKGVTWQLEPHTKIKHLILRRYLQAWFPILSRWNGRIIYIDGFCGPGRYAGGEQGSPLIALDCAKANLEKLHGELLFLFVDKDKERIAHLNDLLADYDLPASFHPHTRCGTFEEELETLLDALDDQKACLAPTFAFIDPFGFSGVPFELVQRILSFRKCEVLINLPIQFANRFLTHPNAVIQAQIVRCFGTDTVLDVAGTPGDRIDACRLIYQKQLQGHARFVRFFEMRGHGNVPLYYLFFATNDSLGHTRMKEAMWKADPDGEFRFSDRTDPNSIALFDIDSTPFAIDVIALEFSGKQDVLCARIRKHIEDESPYLKKHVTSALRRLEAEGTLTAAEFKTDGKKRRARTFPDGAVVSFGEFD